MLVLVSNRFGSVGRFGLTRNYEASSDVRRPGSSSNSTNTASPVPEGVMDRPATTGRTARHSDRRRPCHPSTAKEGRDGMTIVEPVPGITGGVDTHLDKHVAAALDPLDRLVGTESFNADAGGYKALLAWLEQFGRVTKVGVEGTGSYGVGLSRFLQRKGVEVVEVNRPNRQSRRNQGKSDPLDAVEAARAAISGRASQVRARPKMAPSRPSASWWWPSARPARPG